MVADISIFIRFVEKDYMENFSVLMSVYSKEKPEYFDLALQSNLTGQTLTPNEFVLICDGELTPELDSVIEKYQKLYPEILRVYRKNNGGLGESLTFGLEKCTYSLVARSDSDDVCTPDRFERQVAFMKEHPEVGIISSYIDEFIDDWHSPIHTKTLPLTHQELYEMAKFRNPLNHMSVMMRKDEIISVGSYSNIPCIEDYELWVRAMINGVRIANIDKVLVHARTGNGMVQRRSNRKYIRSWQTLNHQMVAAGMIGHITYLRNMAAITAFIFLSPGIKNFLYKKILRR